MTVIIEKDNTVLFSYDTNIIPRRGEQIEYNNKRYKVVSICHNISKVLQDIPTNGWATIDSKEAAQDITICVECFN
jgi:hypothetical protein